jgi:hypothetical protein
MSCNINISLIEKVNFILTILSFSFFVIISSIEINNPAFKTFVYLSVIISLMSRAFQYWIVFKHLKSKCSFNLLTLLSCYITHFSLFASLYHYNFLMFGNKAFIHTGGVLPGNELDTTDEWQVNSTKDFEKNIHINIIHFTAVTSFTVGYGDLSTNSKFGKIVNIFHMMDSFFLLGFLMSKL